MAYRTVHLGLVIEDDPPASVVADYAVALCEADKAHLNVQLAVPTVDVPSGRIFPLIHAVTDEVNAERLEVAKAEAGRIEVSAQLAGINHDCHVRQERYLAARAEFIAAARLADLIIVPRPTRPLATEYGFIEATLFASGRPVLVVPPAWRRGAVFDRILVAWDGSQYAARAVGDALALLVRAREVEVLCVRPDADKSAAGADLAQYLTRHCRAVRLTELMTKFDDPGLTLRDHLAAAAPDLLVMGAYGRPRLLQFILGGTTSLMLAQAAVPVLYSH